MLITDDSQAPSGWQFWAKSSAGGVPHSVWGHLLDSGAVAELVWEHYLSDHSRAMIDDAGAGRGRDLLVLLAAWHDLGKVSPAFQSKCMDLAKHLPGLGLHVGTPGSVAYREGWHAPLSALIADEALGLSGRTSWLAAILEGHHGRFSPIQAKLRGVGRMQARGDRAWAAAQRQSARAVADAFGIDLTWAAGLVAPSRGCQLALAGYVSMCDWIASSDLFPGRGLSPMSVPDARARARNAWAVLGIERGWSDGALEPAVDFENRFGFEPRPLQSLILEAAEEGPGLIIVEAPMGEGKTEAAFMAIEALSRKTGASGFVFAMPTQGTTDAMYDRVRAWTQRVDPTLPVMLLHGKARLNEAWDAAVRDRSVAEVYDEFGMVDDYGMGTSPPPASAPANWLLGRHRQLLAPAVVATVDQVLLAGTRTKFVAMRHAGLFGRVLVIDEVHSYDAYMSVFLHELLRWCARLEVPVVLMSATLPPRTRAELIRAWQEGAGVPAGVVLSDSAGYPRLTACTGSGEVSVRTCEPRGEDVRVRVDVQPVGDPEDVGPIAQDLAAEVADGGCALAILNTVRRAQDVYRLLSEADVPCVLLHGRLTVSERARRAAHVIDVMGAPGRRPERLVVVATQIAEQSFDVDADVLYSDLAPVDLLLQRVGRLHRHAGRVRPPRHATPRLVVTGLVVGDGYTWPRAFAEPAVPTEISAEPKTIYRPRPLMATSLIVDEPQEWSIPSDIPSLVARGYADPWEGPEAQRELMAALSDAETRERSLREARAKTFRLEAEGAVGASTLAGLHGHASSSLDAADSVRDGDEGIEVCLVVRNESGLRTLAGHSLGEFGELAADPRLAREVLGDAVRLRWQEEVPPLPEWATLPLLEGAPTIVLDEGLEGAVGRRRLRYDRELGLVES